MIAVTIKIRIIRIILKTNTKNHDDDADDDDLNSVRDSFGSDEVAETRSLYMLRLKVIPDHGSRGRFTLWHGK